MTLLNNDTVFTLFLKVFPFMSKDAVKLFVAIAAVVIVTVLLTVFSRHLLDFPFVPLEIMPIWSVLPQLMWMP